LPQQQPTKQQVRHLKMSSYSRKIYGFAAVVILTCAATGCATYEKCGFRGCPGDSSITANVKARFSQHPELGAPDSIDVQTLDHVVYLNGLVAVGLERQEAESVALGAPGVRRVVDSIAVTH
jgi:osmotically-inducible protein OsmY